MVDRSRAGMRCRTVSVVRTVEGNLPKNARGTIRYEMENLGRWLVFVDWEQGFSVPVFLHEIEILTPDDARLQG